MNEKNAYKNKPMLLMTFYYEILFATFHQNKWIKNKAIKCYNGRDIWDGQKMHKLYCKCFFFFAISLTKKNPLCDD